MVPTMRRIATMGVLGLGIACAAGCSLASGIGGGSATARIGSVEEGTELAPKWRTVIYATSDVNTADVILSDLDQESLMRAISDESELRGVDGSILRVRMFITPRAGRTPIDYTASNTSATLITMSVAEVLLAV